MKNILSILITLFSLSALAATDPVKAYSMAQIDKAVIIDVREKDELKSGMIKNAKWFPLSRIQNDKNWKKDFDKITGNKKIFLYCRSGNRSGKAMNILKESGISSENIGGFESLKNIMPTSKP